MLECEAIKMYTMLIIVSLASSPQKLVFEQQYGSLQACEEAKKTADQITNKAVKVLFQRICVPTKNMS